MKKILVVGMAMAGVTAFGAIDVAFSNIVGVVRVMSTNKYTLVSVPFEAVGLGLEKSEISLSNLVQNINFSTSDRVQLYSPAGNVMYSWTLNPKGVWTPVGGYYTDAEGNEVKYTPDKANLQAMTKGYALRIYRKKPTAADGSPLPFFLVGQYSALSGSRQIEAGNKIVTKMSLVSFPGIRPFDLNTIQEGVDKDDSIIFTDDVAPLTYTPKLEENGKWSWGYDVSWYEEVPGPRGMPVLVKRVSRKTDDTIVPVGVGFWYASRGGSPTVKW